MPREASKLIAIGPNIPRFCDEQQVLENGIDIERLEEGRLGREAGRAAPKDRGEIEAKAVDPGLARPDPHGIENEAQAGIAFRFERVAAARIIDEAEAGVMAIIARRIETAQRQRRPLGIAFAGMIVDDVEYDLQSGLVQALHRLADLGEAARRQARVGRHEGHRIIAPAIMEAERRQMALIDPGRERHQFHRIDTEVDQILDDRGTGERCHRAAQMLGHFRMAHRERPDRDFIDDAGRLGPATT